MLDLLKETLRLSTISCMLALLTPGVVLLHVPRTARWGRRWLTAVVALFWAISCPLTVDLAARAFTRGYAPIAGELVDPPQAIVLLSSGTRTLRAGGLSLPVVSHESGLRVLETARLYKLLGQPLVIASGGITERDPAARPESEALTKALIELGVPADKILAESLSRNTHDEAVVIRQMLHDRGIERFVMVTSPLHMYRSMLTFEAQGLRPVPSVSSLYPQSSAPIFPLFPNESSLALGDSMLYEGLARLYYWWRGWLA